MAARGAAVKQQHAATPNAPAGHHPPTHAPWTPFPPVSASSYLGTAPVSSKAAFVTNAANSRSCAGAAAAVEPLLSSSMQLHTMHPQLLQSHSCTHACQQHWSCSSLWVSIWVCAVRRWCGSVRRRHCGRQHVQVTRTAVEPDMGVASTSGRPHSSTLHNGEPLKRASACNGSGPWPAATQRNLLQKAAALACQHPDTEQRLRSIRC